MKPLKKYDLDLESRLKSLNAANEAALYHQWGLLLWHLLNSEEGLECLKMKYVLQKTWNTPLTLHSSGVLFYAFHTVKWYHLL